MSAFGEAKVVLTADDRTGAAFKSVQDSLNSMTGLAAKLGVALSVGAFTGFIKSSIDAADSLNDLSKTTGASVETLAGLQLAAKQSGTELETVARGMLKFSGVVLDASNGSKEAADKISALGLNLKTLQAQSPEQQFIALAGALEKFGAEKQGVIVADVLGQKMASLTPLLSEGAKGLGEMLEAGKKLNPITTEMAKQADKFNDSMEEMKMRASGLGVNLANEILPGLNRIIEQFTEGTKIAGSFAGALMLFGTMNPFKSVSESVNDLRSEIAGLEEDRARYVKSNADTSSIDTALDTLKKKLELAKLLQRQEALAGAAGIPIGNEGRGLNAGDGMTDYKKPGEAKKAKKSDTSGVDDYATRINTAVAGAINDSAIVKARELEDQIAALDSLFFDAGLSADVYASAMDKLTKAQDGTSDAAKRLDEMLSNTAGAKLEKDRADMLLLADAYERGQISVEQFTEAAQARLGLVGEATEEVSDFARDMGLSFTSAFEDAMLEGKNFSDVLKALDKDIAHIILRKGLTDPIGNTVSSAVSSSGIGDWFKNLLPSFDVGTDFVPRDMIAQIHKGERIVPAAQNKSGIGGTVNQFIVDMRGASVDAVQRLEALVMQVNGSIERRALSAVSQARTRGAF